MDITKYEKLAAKLKVLGHGVRLGIIRIVDRPLLRLMRLLIKNEG